MSPGRRGSYEHFISAYHDTDPSSEQEHIDALSQLLKDNISHFLGVPKYIDDLVAEDSLEASTECRGAFQAQVRALDDMMEPINFSPDVERQISIVSQEISTLLALMVPESDKFCLD